jgi:NitT/TauT family transport system substrate-binding protein
LVPASGFSAEKVKFGFSWILVAQTIPFYVALDKGYWRTEGLDVNILRGFGSGDAVKKVAAGATDIGAADSATLVIARSKGAMVKEVAMTHMKTMHTICALGGSGITKPRDLIGKKIASTAKASTRVIFPAFTEMNGFKVADITWLTSSYAAVIPSLMTGNADAAVCYAAEMPQIQKMARKAGKRMVAMRFAEHGLNMYGNGVIASDKAIAEKPKFVGGFVRGAVKGWAWSVENRQAATDIYLKHHGEADAKIAREIMDVLADHFVTAEARKHGYGFMTKKTMTRTRDLMARFYGIKNVMPVEDLYTNRFIPKIMPK